MTLHLSVLPDEFVLGYQGRLMRMNGWKSAREGMPSLFPRLDWNVNAERKESCVELLSGICKMDKRQFVSQHTLLHFHFMVTQFGIDGRDNDLAYNVSLRMNGMRMVRKNAFFCEACVEGDQQRYGISYWHRDHQLPGMFWCRHHRVPLRVVKGVRAFSKSPSCSDDHQAVGSKDWVSRLQANGCINRFFHTLYFLMKTPKQYDKFRVARLIRGRAREIGCELRNFGTRSWYLSDEIKAQFDRIWLSHVASKLAVKKRGHFYPPLDSFELELSTGLCGAVNCFLALAVLYDSDELLGIGVAKLNGR